MGEPQGPTIEIRHEGGCKLLRPSAGELKPPKEPTRRRSGCCNNRFAARIDFSGDAGRAGLTMRPEQVLIFGNPKAGTPLMLAEPAAGLDLPVKVLVWEEADGTVWAAYNDPQYVVQRYGLPPGLAVNLAAVVPVIERAAAE